MKLNLLPSKAFTSSRPIAFSGEKISHIPLEMGEILKSRTKKYKYSGKLRGISPRKNPHNTEEIAEKA
jgi:hypothetical protein